MRLFLVCFNVAGLWLRWPAQERVGHFCRLASLSADGAPVWVWCLLLGVWRCEFGWAGPACQGACTKESPRDESVAAVWAAGGLVTRNGCRPGQPAGQRRCDNFSRCAVGYVIRQWAEKKRRGEYGVPWTRGSRLSFGMIYAIFTRILYRRAENTLTCARRHYTRNWHAELRLGYTMIGMPTNF